MPYWNFEYTMAVLYTVVKVGGGTGQGLAIATEVYFVVSVFIPLQTLQKLVWLARLSSSYCVRCS